MLRTIDLRGKTLGRSELLRLVPRQPELVVRVEQVGGELGGPGRVACGPVGITIEQRQRRFHQRFGAFREVA